MRPSEVQDQIEAEAERPDGAESLPVPPWIGCLASALLGLLGVFLVFQVGKLVIQGDLHIGSDSLTPARLWLVTEGDNRGVGWSTASIVSGSRDADQACVETHVRFLLIQADGTAQPVTYCDCYQQKDGSWLNAGVCTPGTAGGS
ncbi:MAG: hypothetical protein WBR18_12775 [Anaerolineales bacterium]